MPRKRAVFKIRKICGKQHWLVKRKLKIRIPPLLLRPLERQTFFTESFSTELHFPGVEGSTTCGLEHVSVLGIWLPIWWLTYISKLSHEAVPAVRLLLNLHLTEIWEIPTTTRSTFWFLIFYQTQNHSRYLLPVFPLLKISLYQRLSVWLPFHCFEETKICKINQFSEGQSTKFILIKFLSEIHDFIPTDNTQNCRGKPRSLKCTYAYT